MKITIDEKVCLKHKMTVEEVLFALAFRMAKKDTTLSNMLAREILVDVGGQRYVTQRWSEELDAILCESSEEVKEWNYYVPLAEKMRTLYPAGKSPGTPYLYKGNTREIAMKLQKFFFQYGIHSDEEVLDATKRYVASFRGDYRYLKLLKYFISKMEDEVDESGNRHKVEHSYLADYLENKESEGEEVNTGDFITKLI